MHAWLTAVGAQNTRTRRVGNFFLRFSTEIAVYRIWYNDIVSCYGTLMLSNGDIFNDLDGHLTRFSRSWHFLKSNI